MKIRRIQSGEANLLASMAKQYTDIIPNLNYNEEHYIKTLNGFIDSDGGVIYLILDENDVCYGGIGGIKYPDILTGEMTAVELFWYTDEEVRRQGIKLYRLFEQWAKDNGCKKLAMIYLPCSMPDKLEVFYKKQGFLLREMHFEKEL